MKSNGVIRIAVGSTDGKVINQHFGRATFFSIVELGPQDWRYVERRENSPPCRGFDHDDGDMARSVAGLWDCTAVLVSRDFGV